MEYRIDLMTLKAYYFRRAKREINREAAKSAKRSRRKIQDHYEWRIPSS